MWVTGGGGFIGRHVLAALRGLGAETVAETAPRADLLDAGARCRAVRHARADVLVHAAWITRHGAFWTAPENLDWCGATLDLVRRFAAGGGRRVVLVGTCAEYDWTRTARTGWRETRACRPASLYGAAKLAAWIGSAAFAREAGLTAAAARLFAPVGPGESPQRLLPSLLRAASGGTALATGPADLTRDFIDVRDAGDAVARIALGDVQGPVNVGSGRGVSLGELARRIGAPVRHASRPPRDEPLWMVADTTRLRRATGFAPRFTLDATIADSAAGWRAEA